MPQGSTVITDTDQRQSEDAIANQERAGRGLRLGDRQEIGGMIETGRHSASGVVRDPKPEKHEEMEWGPDRRGLGHEPICSLQRGEDFWIGVAFAGHQRRDQGEVDIELQLLALASFG